MVRRFCTTPDWAKIVDATRKLLMTYESVRNEANTPVARPAGNLATRINRRGAAVPISLTWQPF
jgi:hypothetical protein